MNLVSFVVAAAAAAQVSVQPAAVQPAPTAAIAPAAPQAVILAPPSGNTLRAGTEVPLRLEEGLDSNDKTLREGHQFRMTVANDVRLGSAVVIPAGSPVTGEITDLRRKGMWASPGGSSPECSTRA